MSNDQPDPAHVAAFIEGAKVAEAKQLRAERPDLTEEEIAAIVEQGSASVIWSKASTSGEGTDDFRLRRRSGSAPATPANLRRVRRQIEGNDTGRRSDQDARIERIVDAALNLGGAATRLRVAQNLGMVDGTGSEEWGQYREDVRAAGGWDEIKSRVRARRGQTGK